MDCKKVQRAVLTDYIDGQMGDRQVWLLEQHLADCPACQGFLRDVKNEVQAPFTNVSSPVPDGLLWDGIKQAIEEEQRLQLEKSLRPDLWQRLRLAVHIPRPAFALATVMTMIFMIGTTGQLFMNSQPVGINGEDQMEYISSLIDEPAGLAANNGNDPQTPIEQYFL